MGIFFHFFVVKMTNIMYIISKRLFKSNPEPTSQSPDSDMEMCMCFGVIYCSTVRLPEKKKNITVLKNFCLCVQTFTYVFRMGYLLDHRDYNLDSRLSTSKF